MKFFTLTLCIVTVLSFSSCNNDDEDTLMRLILILQRESNQMKIV